MARLRETTAQRDEAKVRARSSRARERVSQGAGMLGLVEAQSVQLGSPRSRLMDSWTHGDVMM